MPHGSSASSCFCGPPLRGALRVWHKDFLTAFPNKHVVALWEALHIENKRFDLDSLRVPSRSPTPISKSKDFPAQSDDFWGARGLHFRSILGVPGARAGLKYTYVLALCTWAASFLHCALAWCCRGPLLVLARRHFCIVSWLAICGRGL